MPDLTPWYEFRQQMVDLLEADLMGGVDDLELTEPPLDRFVLGILHPRESGVVDDADSETESGDDSGSGADAVFDPAVALSHMRYPSSMGMTFAVDVGMTPTVLVETSAARYREAPSEEGGTSWQREAVEPDPVPLGTTSPSTRRIQVHDGLELYSVVRRAVDGIASVTVVLVNTLKAEEKGRSDAFCWFQPRLAVRAGPGRFVPRRAEQRHGVDDEDLDSYMLLFRSVEDLAVGHGCAVTWDESSAVTELRATFLPWHDVRVAEPAGGAGVTLPMQDLASSEDPSALRELVQDYRGWISRRRAEIPSLEQRLQETARRHLEEASRAADRMQRGIELLERDANAGRAFGLMNRAMNLQRERQDAQRGMYGAVQAWRPFQMAFILLNLEGVADPTSDDREIADLLWFPTGGGKTEAYLGLIGFTILLRRLSNPHDSGVSVIMRYTLRLLTIQQFERAAGLICALESIRRTELPTAAAISLGLWVGQGATPNSVKNAKTALNSLRNGQNSPEGNPVQLLHCPVCGTSLTLDDYRIKSGPDRMEVRCHDASCEYGKGLPVHLVDEDVYRERPSLIIGTVDKFAMMAWRSEVRNLFSRDGKNSPPDLIVQDELHLISGPLGTMVGLYEAAVDTACTGDDQARPKVVASTATIRRASDQVRAVFDREARQFPPPGLDSTDSYFSVEAPPEQKGTRRYLGVLAPSVSHTTLMVRCYAALLQAAQDIEGDDRVRDAYWTLLGYFNSLRVLGGAYMQVLDDVPDRLKVVSGRKGTEPRPIDELGELTSRIDSSEIPGELARLGTGYPDDDVPDVVLATNMISVGVDVDRLGLMAVMGQPQTTAEYIQSTSRVGRKYPGLVVVLYNAARSRDLSHYESFGSYHRALYRQVEATGATPFAARARDRGLHGVLVSMVRLLVDELANDERAVQMPRFTDEVDRVVERVVERAARIAPQEADRVAGQLQALVDSWRHAAEEAPTLKYAGWFDSAGALLQDAGQVLKDEEAGFPVDEPAWPTMTSLRDVDVTSGLYVVPPTRGK